jgi:hypothetical protein
MKDLYCSTCSECYYIRPQEPATVCRCIVLFRCELVYWCGSAEVGWYPNAGWSTSAPTCIFISLYKKSQCRPFSCAITSHEIWHVYKHCNVKGNKRCGILFGYSKSVSLFLTRKLLIVFTRPHHETLYWARLPQCKSRARFCQHTERAGAWLYGAESHPPSCQGFFNSKRKTLLAWNCQHTAFYIHG